MGAGSKIYQAVSRKSGSSVAIKHVVRESADDDRFLVQAENEHAIASKLDHPALRRYLSIHRVRRRLQTRELLLVMEYVEGLTLEKALPNRLNSFLVLFHHVAQGLHAMHLIGFVHTDIKPINLMIAKGGVVKIIDFGQACKMNHRKERIQGTPDYIAPEQVRRLSLDQRTDVFNLGATMYWVLTGTTYPTDIRGPQTVGAANVIASRRPVVPHEHNDKIPLSLSKLVMQCCKENPADRPADMKQVTARLEVVRKLWKKHRESAREERSAAASEPLSDAPSIAEDSA